ncbi:MAG: DEAD/DEAH box helicase [Gammaproteobacteria bacterium]
MTSSTEMLFEALELPEQLRQGVRTAGFTHCTPIQAQTLPLALAGKDVAGQAQTGTGKTAAFLLACFNYLLKNGTGKPSQGPRAVMLAPTRELAIQIYEDAKVLGSSTEFRCQVVYGGADYEEQRQRLLNGVDVLIGTPGRFIDYFKQGVFSLKNTQVMVLDEADRMFDLGFIRDIRYVLRRLPPPTSRLNMLFSATLSHRVIELAYEHMNDPEVVRIEPDKMTVDRVTQLVYFPSNDEKLPLLMSLLRSAAATRTMVFVNMKRDADRVAQILQHNGMGAKAISGDVPQKKRLSMLRNFQSGELPVLVATDVASRGLHVPDVSHVVNYDLPFDPEDYVHRIGRTARAGASGDAISFACESYAASLPDIESFLGHAIPVGTIDSGLLADIEIPPPPRRRPNPRGHSQRSGGRGNKGKPPGRKPPGRR